MGVTQQYASNKQGKGNKGKKPPNGTGADAFAFQKPRGEIKEEDDQVKQGDDLEYATRDKVIDQIGEVVSPGIRNGDQEGFKSREEKEYEEVSHHFRKDGFAIVARPRNQYQTNKGHGHKRCL